MKILELHILEFGGLSDRHFTLSDGLNIFEGENEAGKSTVWLFIKFMLYGMPRKGHEERERSVNWRTHRAIGSMRVSHAGKEYRIERSFTESGRVGNDKLAVYDHQSGELVFSDRVPGEVFLGVPREVFESTCGIGQMQLANLGGKKGADAIRNLLSGADETVDISHVESKLDKIRVQYRHKNGKGGRIFELSGALSESKKRLENAQNTKKHLSMLEDKMQRNQAQSAQTEEKLAQVSERLTQLGTLELLRRFERLRAMEAQVGVLEEEIATLRRREQKTERVLCEADAAELRNLSEQLRATAARREAQAEQKHRLLSRKTYDEADAEVGERLSREGGAEAVLRKMRKHSHAVGVCFGIGGAVALLGGILCLVHLLITAIAVPVGGILCVLGILSGAKRKKLAAEFGQTPSTLEAYLTRCTAALDAKRELLLEMTEADAALGATEHLLNGMTEQLRAALLRTLPEHEVTPTVASAEREMIRISAFLREMSALDGRKAALVQSITHEREGLSQYDEAALKARLTVDLSELQGLDPVRLENERKFLKTQSQALSDSFRSAQIELISAKANAEDPMALADRVEALDAEYRRADEYYQTLEMALGALSCAAETMSGNVAPVLGRRAGEMMAYISAGRYETLTAGADYTPSLLDEHQLTVTADLLSAGTRDAAYLSLRIALAMQLFSEELPPLMLDDALCQIDDRRMLRILTLLSKLGAKDLQCLLFTCHRREALTCEQEALPYARHSL